MNPESAIELLRSLITVSLSVVSPIVGVAIVVGVLVSILQAVTSIQEQALSFVPKLAAIGILLIVTAPWVLRQVMQFTVVCLSRLPEMAK
jgi:flagellar biosynthetic protein FliQ